MGPLIAIALMFLVFWVLIILPQQRRVRAHQALVRSIEVGDEVMTTSGLYGTIATLDTDDVTLEVAPGTTLRFARGAIAKKIVDEPEPEPEAAAEPAVSDETASDPADAAVEEAVAVDETAVSDETASDAAEIEEAGSVTTPSDNSE
jgi:preprotein translocase subunit YajC